MFRGFVVLAALASLVAPAAAQDERIAEEPTGGLNLPTVPVAGEVDAFTTVVNPAGLVLLGGTELGIGLDLENEDDATGSGPGVGLYTAGVVGGEILPRIGWGVGLELLRPSNTRLDPDPGSPARLTLSWALPIGGSSGLGVSWHHFFDDHGNVADGLDTWDIGLVTRFGSSRWAAGAVIRDVGAPTLKRPDLAPGEDVRIPVQRRYELEITSRPLATDRLELALGGRVGETRADLDGWLRWSVKLRRGLYFRGEVLTRELHVIEMTPSGQTSDSEFEWRGTAGLEVSFGHIGTTALASGVLDDERDARFGSGTLLVRAGAQRIPSVQKKPRRIERIDLDEGLSSRELTSMLLRLRAAARDDDVVAVLVKVDGVGVGWASLQELRREIARVREAGKKVYAYTVAGTSRDYFVATAADEIYVDPAGGIRLAGFAGTSLYFKGLFDLIGVNAQFEKIEEYKSAPEAFTRKTPSEPALAMREELYDSLYESFVAGIAEGRKLSPEQVRELIDGGPYTAGDLEGDTRLVDGIATPDELGKIVAEGLGRAYPVAGRPNERPTRWSYPKIAVIYIDGDIIDGKSRNVPLPIPFIGGKLVGGDTISEAVAAARADRDIEAIVLRIDSPGGSALASEKMAREVFKTRKVKPVICSMGDIAASGGYFAAAGCEVIFAEPMTITGSIGIFYGKFDLSTLLGRLGISWHTFKRGARSDMESYFRPYTPEERELLKEKLGYLYGRFTGAVAEGRGLTKEKVDAVGRGRVWTGAMAVPVDLVDRTGSLTDAITYAKERAGYGDDDKVQLVLLPKPKTSLLGRVLGIQGLRARRAAERRERAAAEAEAAAGFLIPPATRELLRYIPASIWLQGDRPQARLPFTIVWE